MDRIVCQDQSACIDLLMSKSKRGDPDALFELGKILWNRGQCNFAKFCLEEASKKGQIEAEQFLNRIGDSKHF